MYIYFVAYTLKNYSVDFNENLRDYFQKYQKSLESKYLGSLNHVEKNNKCQIQSTTCSFPMWVELFHKARSVN